MDANGPSAEALLYFHDFVIIFVLCILILVLPLLSFYLLKLPSHRYLRESQFLEFLWTTAPLLTLVVLALPSLQLLYLLDEVGYSGSTSCVTSSQWYWSFESSDLLHPPHDSYLQASPYRLLAASCPLSVYYGINTRLLLTSSDVLHSFALPSFGVKADCVPGRLNSLVTVLDRSGLFYGQCSEICGSNHSFMPIACEVLRLPPRVTFR